MTERGKLRWTLAVLLGLTVIRLLLALLAIHSGGVLAPIAAHMAYSLLQFQTLKGTLGR